MARSSSAICDGPSAPISTPACDPHSRRSDAGDRAHPDEVVGAGEERGERGRERAVPAHGDPGRGGHQLLLGDEHLEVTVGVGVRELVGEGRVADLAVQRRRCGRHARRGRRARRRKPSWWRPSRRPRTPEVRAWPGTGRLLRPRSWAWPAPGPARPVPAAGRGHVRLRTPPSSAIARSAMSGGNGLPCQPSLFSTSENPLPLMVLARITVGWLAQRCPPRRSSPCRWRPGRARRRSAPGRRTPPSGARTPRCPSRGRSRRAGRAG